MAKIFLPICTNGGGVDAKYAAAMLGAFCGRQDSLTIAHFADPHPANVLSRATHFFLNETDCEEMVIIDADIEAERRDVDRLLSHDLSETGLIFGWYHKKVFPPEACVVGLDGDVNTIWRANCGIKEVRAAGRGFVRISRKVFLDLIEAEKATMRTFSNFGPDILEVWQSGVNERGEFEHEDFNFCRRVRALGYRVLIDTHIHVRHWGAFPYGCIPKLEWDSVPRPSTSEPTALAA